MDLVHMCRVCIDHDFKMGEVPGKNVAFPSGVRCRAYMNTLPISIIVGRIELALSEMQIEIIN